MTSPKPSQEKRKPFRVGGGGIYYEWDAHRQTFWRRHRGTILIYLTTIVALVAFYLFHLWVWQ